jgi:hypothetical protein
MMRMNKIGQSVVFKDFAGHLNMGIWKGKDGLKHIVYSPYDHIQFWTSSDSKIHRGVQKHFASSGNIWDFETYINDQSILKKFMGLFPNMDFKDFKSLFDQKFESIRKLSGFCHTKSGLNYE